MMESRKYLIVNADDFGQSSGVNLGVIKAHEQGIVTSASLMTRWPAAAEAADYAREHPKLSVGLHLDLGEWAYSAGTWVPLYNIVPLDDVEAINGEIVGQLATFRRFLARNPTHIDSHQHVHLREPVRSAVIEIALRLRIPLRDLKSPAHYCGDFYGQTPDGCSLPDFISNEALIKILRALRQGTTELGCHPAALDDLETMYRSERLEELRVLCDPEVRAAIDALGIKLCSFCELPADWQDATLFT